MNIIKGMDRAALVIAIIAMAPAFIVGWNFYKQEKTTVKTEKRLLSPSELSQRLGIPEEKNYNPDDREVIEHKYGISGSNRDSNVIYYDPDELEPYTPEETIYQHPPQWQCAIAGFLGSCIVFTIVLFGLRGLTRVSVWVVEGFKE